MRTGSPPRVGPRSRAGRLGLIASVALAVVATWLTVPPPVAMADTAPPTGGFALAGGVGGDIDQRTGQLSASVPITTVRGNGQASLAIALTWQQDRAAAGVDRSGWGAGWSMGNTFVDVTGQRRVYPASGGGYFLDPSEPSGLKNYKLRDLTFASTPATVSPTCAGGPAPAYAFSLTYDDGRVDCFDTDGNLASRLDRFGNRTNLTWQGRSNNVWRPTAITDSYGLTTTFDYSTQAGPCAADPKAQGQVKVIAPKRSDGVQATTVIALTTASGVASVTDPACNRTSFDYASVSGAAKPLVKLITAATAARTVVTYQTPQYEPTLTAVSTLEITDATGKVLSPVRTFSLDPFPANSRHNFTGYPNHVGTGGEDGLFQSGDPDYTYSTSLATGSTTTLATYDALHRLTSRTISVVPAAGQQAIPAQSQTLAYATKVTTPANLPANFARPSTTSLIQSATTSAAGIKATSPRTTTAQTSYDDHGRIVSATDEVGTTTTTQYDDRFGRVSRQTTTGADGSQAQLVNTLTDDGKSVQSSTTSVGQQGATLSARQKLAYTYAGNGDLLTRTLTWAPGAKPASDTGGPDQIVTKFDRSTPTTAGSENLTTTTGFGTPEAEVTTTKLDLVSGLAMSSTDGLGRTTAMSYDAAGRQTAVTTPGGLTTTTAYTATQTTVTGPDGHVTRTTKDPLGRMLTVTDNVLKGGFVSNPATRVLSSTSYSADGMSVTATDQAGRTSTRVLDPFGRTVSQGDPTGLTHLTAYDPGAAHSKVDSLVPEGAVAAASSTVTRYDDADRAVSSKTNYPLPAVGGRPGLLTSDPVTSTIFDGLGQPSTTTGNDLTVSTDRSGTGGLPVDSTATPQATTSFPGTAITATTVRDLTGAATARTLTQGDQTSKAVSVAYDATGHVSQATDPGGRVTSYGYDDAGAPLTKTDPSGAVTTNTYDHASGLLSGITVTAPGRPTRTVSYTRIPAGQAGAGQIRAVTDATGTITYGYDADGHRTSVQYPDGTATSAAYNDKGQLASATDVTGAVTFYAYDPNSGAMTTVNQTRGTATLASLTYTYDGLGRLRTTTRGNHTVTTDSYTAGNDLADVSTVDAAGRVIEDHAYSYDKHHNPITRTDTYPASAVAQVGSVRTWTTTYSYDAYDRLVGSAVYSGPLLNGQPQGVPSLTTSYTVDVAGNVTGAKTVRRLPGIRPLVVTKTTTNTIDDSDRLTGQQVGGTTGTQTFDDDGRVTKTPSGVTLSYGTGGAVTGQALPDGTKTTYSLWPDGSRRSAVTTDAEGRTSTVTYHYGTDGALVNDSTSDASTGSQTAATASYLITTGREARTLLAGTGVSGRVTGTANAQTTTGQGVGYYLRDRHTSVTAMVDAAGTVTASYAYGDYGAPARPDGSPATQTGGEGGLTNPFSYLGGATKGPVTEAGSGLLTFTQRIYDAGQGRFLSPDPVDAHNRYQGFRTNPIYYAELDGAVTTADLIIDIIFAIVFVATAIVTFGTASAVIGAAEAAAEVGELTAGVVANVAANVVGVAANSLGAVTSGMLALDDLTQVTSGGKEKLLSDTTRNSVTLINSIASATAGATGLVAGLTDFTVSAAETATMAANDAKLSPDDFEELIPKPAAAPADQAPAPADPPVANAGNNQGAAAPGDENGNALPDQRPGQRADHADSIADTDDDEPLDLERIFGQPQREPENPVGHLDPSDKSLPGFNRQPDGDLLQENPEVSTAAKLIGSGSEAAPAAEGTVELRASHTADMNLADQAAPQHASDDPGTGQPTSDFTNTNVQILVQEKQ